jgi:hypothetical protein
MDLIASGSVKNRSRRRQGVDGKHVGEKKRCNERSMIDDFLYVLFGCFVLFLRSRGCFLVGFGILAEAFSACVSSLRNFLGGNTCIYRFD